tara:strand:+ start:677 stop:916 length:240 start_codon:yes stop_codon:yes gene_type:complete
MNCSDKEFQIYPPQRLTFPLAEDNISIFSDMINNFSSEELMVEIVKSDGEIKSFTKEVITKLTNNLSIEIEKFIDSKNN